MSQVKQLTAEQALVFSELPAESFAVISSTLSPEAISQVETARMAKVLTHLEKNHRLVPESERDADWQKAADTFLKLLPVFSEAAFTLLASEERGVQGSSDRRQIVKDSKMFPVAVGGMVIKFQKTL